MLPMNEWFCLCISLTLFYSCDPVYSDNFAADGCRDALHFKDCDVTKSSEIGWNAETYLCKEELQPMEIVESGGSDAIIKCSSEYLDFNRIRGFTNCNKLKASRRQKSMFTSSITPMCELFAVDLVDRQMLPLQCENQDLAIEIGVGFVLLQGGYPEVAEKHFNKLLLKNKRICAGLYYGRAKVYTKMTLSDSGNAARALKDYGMALDVAKSEEALHIYEARAEVFTNLGQHAQAYADYTEALKIKPSSNLYLMRGICLVYMEKYASGYNDLKESLKLQPRQTLALHYQASCLFHMRRMEDSIKTYETVLLIQPRNTDIMQSIAQAHRELGNFDEALKFYEMALNVHPTSPRLFQSKAELLFKHGKIPEALEAFRHCVSLEPFNSACQLQKGLCYASMGQFYQSVKEITTVADFRPVEDNKGMQKYPAVMYLREWCRYVHAHLDVDINAFNVDEDINPDFKGRWVRNMDFVLQNYTEQPGLQPHIKDVTAIPWEQQPPKIQRLLCGAFNIGRDMHLHGAVFGSDPNFGDIRAYLALGLASIEISQTVQEFWKAPKRLKNKSGKKYTWRDVFDIPVKWLRFIPMDKPGIFWLDNPMDLAKQYVHRIILIQGNQTTHGYEKYLPKLYKVLLQDAVGTYRNEAFLRNGDNQELMESFHNLYNAEEKAWDKEKWGDTPYIRSLIQIKSKKDRARKSLDGYSAQLQLDSEKKLFLSIDQELMWPRVQQYHAELEFLWQRIADEYKKLAASSNAQSTTDSLINLILSLSYYFFNLFPLSRSTNTVSYSTAIGLILALGRETTGMIPKGKEVYMEAVTINDHEKFRSVVRSWLSFKKVSNSMKKLERVSGRFHTFRDILQVLQYDLSTLCIP